MKQIMSQAEIDADRPRWLEERRQLITGTDITGIVRAGGYGSPAKVYWSKTAGIERPDSMQLLMGRHDEFILAELYAGLHPDVHPGYQTPGSELVNAGLCVSDERPWQGSTFDRIEEPDGVVVEFKTSQTRDDFGTPPHGDVPLRMLVQALWEADVRSAKVVKLVVFFRPFGPFECFWITIDDNALEDIDYFRRRASEFRDNHLLPGVPPPADGRADTTLALKSVYSVVDREFAVVPKRLWQNALRARARRVAAEEAEAAAKNLIAERQQNAKWAVTRDGTRVMQRRLSWPRRIDLNRLRADFPEAAAMCTVQPAADEPQIAFVLVNPKEQS